MLTYFIRKAHSRNVWVRPRIVITVPSELTLVEKRAVKACAYRARAREGHLVEENMAAAIGAGMPVTEPSGNMIVNIRDDVTEIAVISLAGIVYSKAVRVARNEMNEAIIQFVRKTYNLLISEWTAEKIRLEIGSAYPLVEQMTMEMWGRHIIELVPKRITITEEDVRWALAEPVDVIVDAVRVALESTPPELSADIVGRGIVLTGDGSLLKNLDRRIREETGLPLAMAEDPFWSSMLAAERMLADANFAAQDLRHMSRLEWVAISRVRTRNVPPVADRHAADVAMAPRSGQVAMATTFPAAVHVYVPRILARARLVTTRVAATVQRPPREYPRSPPPRCSHQRTRGAVAAGDATVHQVPGDHVSMLKPPNVALVAEVLLAAATSA